MKKESTMMTNLAKRAVAVGLCATLGIAACTGTAFAYFTANTQASGGHPIELGYSSEIYEGIDQYDGSKSIVMVNTGNTDIKVRVQLFYGTGVNDSVVVTPMAEGTDEGWSEKDGMYWWDGVLKPGQSTGILKVTVESDKEVEIDNFDVTVIGQTSSVHYEYDEDGNEIVVSDLWETQN